MNLTHVRLYIFTYEIQFPGSESSLLSRACTLFPLCYVSDVAECLPSTSYRVGNSVTPHLRESTTGKSVAQGATELGLNPSSAAS